MPSIDEIFRSNETLRACDLPPNVDVPVVIDAVEPKFFDDGAKLQISFRGKTRVLLANQTNSRAIASLLGPDYTVWSGKLIHLRRATTDFKGQLVECVRVSLTPPAQPAARMTVPEPPAMPTAAMTREANLRDGDEIPF